MIRNFLNTSTQTSIGILILYIVIENRFPEVFKDNEKAKRIRISLDFNDWRKSMFLITTIAIVLFTTDVNLIFSSIYSFYIVFHTYMFYRD